MSYNYTPDYNDGSLTRGEALDMIDAAVNGGTLRELVAEWTPWRDWSGETGNAIEDWLRDYVAEACMDLDGDAIRSNGPKDSDYTGISS